MHAVARIVNYMDIHIDLFNESIYYFPIYSYRTLLWMLHRRNLKNQINKILKRALELVYQNIVLTFTDLLERYNPVAINQRNMLVLATEIFKLRKDLAHNKMKDVFKTTETFYNLRSEANYFKRENVKTTHFVIQSVRCLGPKIWGFYKN